jgi:hypothetical protein
MGFGMATVPLFMSGGLTSYGLGEAVCMCMLYVTLGAAFLGGGVEKHMRSANLRLLSHNDVDHAAIRALVPLDNVVG